MRHGATGPNAIEDAARVLSLEGRAEVIHVGAALRRRSLLASAVVSSPYLRARQTAELLSEALDLPRLEDDKRLIPAGDPEALALGCRSALSDCCLAPTFDRGAGADVNWGGCRCAYRCPICS